MEQPFEKRYVKYEAGMVLPGCRYVRKENNYFIFTNNDDTVLIFKDFESAMSYVDEKTSRYFDENRDQLLPFYIKYVNERWNKLVDWLSLYRFIATNFDELTGRRWEKNEKKKKLEGIYDDAIGYIRNLCDNDLGKISEVVYSFINRKAMIEAINDGAGQAIYEHGSYFYVIEVDIDSLK